MDKNVDVPRTRLSTLPASVRPEAATHAARDTGPMFFLLRMAFWLGIVLILLPTGSGRQAPATDVGAADAISAASATVQDLRGFCSRQPDACTVGSEVAVAIGYKAQAGAKMIFDFLTEKLASRDNGATTGSVGRLGGDKRALDKSAPEKASQDTLTPADLIPAWRGPPVHKDTKHTA